MNYAKGEFEIKTIVTDEQQNLKHFVKKHV